MKNLILPIITLILFAACKKDAADPVTTPTPSLITSVSTYDAESRHLRTDSFEYDQNGRLISSDIITRDSSETSTTDEPIKYVFAYEGDDSLPVSFSIGNEFHFLQYDDHQQVIKDSVTNLYTYYFTYSDTVIYTSLILPPNIGRYEDTLNIQHGNIVSRNYWYIPPMSLPNRYRYDYTYSNLPNPIYNLKNLPVLLGGLVGKDPDFISQNLYSSYTLNLDYSETVTWNTKDGLVTGGQGTYTDRGNVHHIIKTFRYK